MLETNSKNRTEWKLRAARAEDLAAVQGLLKSCDLPLGGLSDQFVGHYVVAEKNGEIIGVAGLETHGANGLLRSVSVAPERRDAGLGRELVRERIAWAHQQGIESIYLLTTTAEDYFVQHGFAATPRDQAPTAIQSSVEFTQLCPSTATLMQYMGGHVNADDPEAVRIGVREHYGRAAREARTARSSCCGGSCGADDPISSNLYDPEELAGIPEEVIRASLGCGNPALLAELREGETVLDLGSGGGIDVLLSARRVGPTGKAYGLDMTDDMLALARDNQSKAGVTNVEFLKGEIEHMPLPDSSVDVIISNCVINLSADKRRVLGEAFRVLKPGGRFAVSDIVVRREIPAKIRRSAELWAGCIAGALEEWTYRELLRDAGFENIEVVPTRVYTAEDAGMVAPEVELDEQGLRALDGAFMSAFVRATKARKGGA